MAMTPKVCQEDMSTTVLHFARATTHVTSDVVRHKVGNIYHCAFSVEYFPLGRFVCGWLTWHSRV